MNISFNGYKNSIATFIADGATEGYPVEMAGNYAVSDAQEEFIGICTSLSGDIAGVQLGGYVEMRYSGEAPALGWAYLAADGEGGVLSIDSGAARRLVIKVDEDNSAVGFIL